MLAREMHHRRVVSVAVTAFSCCPPRNGKGTCTVFRLGRLTLHTRWLHRCDPFCPDQIAFERPANRDCVRYKSTFHRADFCTTQTDRLQETGRRRREGEEMGPGWEKVVASTITMRVDVGRDVCWRTLHVVVGPWRADGPLGT